MDKNVLKNFLIVLIIVVLVALFFIFDFNKYLTLTYLKESRDAFSLLYGNNRVLIIFSYMLIYIVVTALSLPGAAILSLAGGALFGFWAGFIMVSFASTIGATVACFVSRFLLRNWVENKFKDKFDTINRGVEKDGGFYLFTLRLIPIFPFFIINLLMGLTKMPLLTYYWVSQIGMIPGTAVYVNAGKELGKIDSLSGILSPTLIISFALLGIFPLIIKKILDFYMSRYRK